MPTDRNVPLEFPLGGIDVTREFQEQPPGTCADALNVRAKDAIARRERGGSRPGLSKYVAQQVPAGAVKIQHLKTIVDTTTAALRQNFLTPGDDWVADPRYPTIYVPPNGSGDQPNPNAGQPAAPHPTHVQSKRAKFDNASGQESVSFDAAVVTNHTLVAFVLTEIAGTAGVGVTVTNGGSAAYTQAGSYVEILDPRTLDTYVRLSCWYKTANSGSDDNTVKVTPGAAFVGLAVTILEYSGMPTSSQVDSTHTNSDTALAPPAPATTGNVAILGSTECLLGAFGTILDASGFTPGAGFTCRPNADDGSDFDFRLNVVEKTGLSFPGSNPTAATGTTTAGEDPYVAIGVSFKD